MVGTLILRGNRCVLARSLMEPPVWKGMRIPMVTLRPDESPIDGAIRAASEHCDIEEVVENIRELERVSEVAPASLYLEDGQHALIYVLYAARPPPPGALEDADLTDEDDLYDWYTWPRAVNVLRHDARALATLRTLACAVANAVSAGRLSSKWGGYFGQEWLEPSVPAAIASPLPVVPAPVHVASKPTAVQAKQTQLPLRVVDT